MIKIDFVYNNGSVSIDADENQTFKEVVPKFLAKSLSDPNSLSFLANGSNVNPECKIINLMNSENQNSKNIKILVNQFKDDDKKESSIIQSKGVICPECLQPCRLEIKNYKIKLYDCANKHVNENIKLKDYKSTQMIDRKKIICNNCKRTNLFEAYNRQFYKCLLCELQLCPICKSTHDKNHNLIPFDQKNFICKKHSESFIKYCKDCKINICFM